MIYRAEDRTFEVPRYDDTGCFGVVIESAGQAPILLESEGADTTFDAAMARAKKVQTVGGPAVRYCVVRLVPVAGNELLLADLQRSQAMYQTKIPF